MRRRLWGKVGMAVLGATALAMTMTGCGQLPFGNDDPPVSSVAAGEDAGGDVDFDAAIGDCVKLTGYSFNAEIEHATCGKAPANYVVIAKSPTKEACPSDADSTYYVTKGGEQQGALCLDLDWVEGECMEVPTSNLGDAEHVECTETGSGLTTVSRVLAIIPGTIDESRCPDDSTQYYTYDERKKLVCVGEA
ncbi:MULTISPECIES: hypothetical protein [Gordonia]|nr:MULTISPECIES: hypothetical protein [Gordonia]WLP92328.1 hypothetical protein Q9K23_08930 [Gordonia sp. NB41Y]